MLIRPAPFLIVAVLIVTALLMVPASGEDADQPRARATPAGAIELLPGFRAELLYSVPREERGSWVSMTFDPRGRIIASDQEGPLYRVTPPPIGESEPVEVERVEVRVTDEEGEPTGRPLGAAQGLLYAFDSLYVMVNGPGGVGNGLYRLRDTNGDDRYDSAELLRRMEGGGEHGPHAIVLSPDGESLYIVAGNHTQPPDLAGSRVPLVWDEDHLLPRMWDAGGHAVGVMAPGGWIAKTDPDGREFELISAGYRNAYDIAFNTEGELFTYDSDMEWDIGTPWYRPTRAIHPTSGSEFGWRSGSGKWPEHYPDSLGSVYDVGVGSPTGVTFGYGAAFPAKYQHALYLCDWSFGKLYVLHIEEDGASYTGRLEQFAAASPLPLTDLAVSPTDGALYFTIGGRSTQSGLYRVTYTGDEPTDAVEPVTDARNRELRETRHSLEAFHGREHPDALDAAWPRLSHDDRHIRYASRIAVEHQPVEHWRSRALEEREPVASIHALIALARHGDASLQEPLVDALNRIDFADLPEPRQLDLLRAYQLAFIRMGEPDDAVRGAVLDRLDGYYPAGSVPVNRELGRLLVYLRATDVIDRTLTLLANAPTQEEQIHYAYILRVVEDGWTAEQRKAYFGWFNRARAYHGGASFRGFLDNIREAALEHVDDETKAELADILEADGGAADPFAAEPRRHVRDWQADEVVEAVEGGLSGRDYERGRRMFAAAACFACHRFAGEGGAVGPDLTGLAGRYSVRDLAEKIVNPNVNVSDQYRNTIFTLEDGEQVMGRVANLHGDRIQVVTNQFEPGNLTAIDRNGVVSAEESPVSPMPPGLINTLDEGELRDLFAYLLSEGDRDHEMFD